MTKNEKEIKYEITIQEEGKEKLMAIFILGGNFNRGDHWNFDLYKGGIEESIKKLASEYYNKYYHKKRGL
jgi:hypothetical protein